MAQEQQDFDKQNGDQQEPGQKPSQASQRGEAMAANELEKKLGLDKSLALTTLASGKSVAETSRMMGITRMTIYNWLKKDPEFRAAYNQWHNEVQHSMRGRVAAMADLAIDAVNSALAKGDGRLGMQYLKNMKAFEPAVVEKAANAGEARQEIDLEEDRRRVNQEIEALKIKTEKQKAENDLSITTPITDEEWENFGKPKKG